MSTSVHPVALDSFVIHEYFSTSCDNARDLCHGQLYGSTGKRYPERNRYFRPDYVRLHTFHICDNSNHMFQVFNVYIDYSTPTLGHNTFTGQVSICICLAFHAFRTHIYTRLCILHNLSGTAPCQMLGNR